MQGQVFSVLSSHLKVLKAVLFKLARSGYFEFDRPLLPVNKHSTEWSDIFNDKKPKPDYICYDGHQFIQNKIFF